MHENLPSSPPEAEEKPNHALVASEPADEGAVRDPATTLTDKDGTDLFVTL